MMALALAFNFFACAFVVCIFDYDGDGISDVPVQGCTLCGIQLQSLCYR